MIEFLPQGTFVGLLLAEAIDDCERLLTELKERERHQAFLIDWSDRVRGETAPEAIMAVTLEWLGAHLGASRTTYAESDTSGRRFTVTGEWRDGVASIRGNSFFLENVGAAVDREWTVGEIVRYEDVAHDPRLEASAIERTPATCAGTTFITTLDG